jgi:hypothetical protein
MSAKILNFQPVPVAFDLTCTTTAAIAANDVLADSQQVQIIPDADAPKGGLRGNITGLHVADEDDLGANIDIVILEDSTSLGTEHGAITISAADSDAIIKTIRVRDYDDYINSQHSDPQFNPIKFKCQASTPGSLWVGAIYRGAGSQQYTTGVVRCILEIEITNEIFAK